MTEFETLFEQLDVDAKRRILDVMEMYLIVDRKYKELIQCNK